MSGFIWIAALGHVVFCLVYSKMSNAKIQEFLFTLIFTLFMPVVGPLTLIISKIASSEPDIELIEHAFETGSFDNERKLFNNPININSELNQISIEEALNVGSFETRRKMIMETMQSDDLIEYLGVLKEALLNEDVETVHYASSVIMETQRKINDAVISMKVKYKRDPKDEKNIEDFETALERIIFSGAYDERNLNKYYQEYRILSDEIFKLGKIQEKYLKNRIRVDFNLGDFTHAHQICQMYREKYPKSEDMVLLNMKYYVMTYDKKGLEEFMDSIGELKSILKYDSLDYVKFYT